ncbi:MAG: hypothetical protein KJO07_00125 [Deltaproteobacteria bacterium]|nr:hypothetical protein [Deltaproteobacteria bacterium]
MSDLPPAQFRKTKSGKWAVMAPVVSLEAALHGDGKVEVLKKSGDWSTFTVSSLGKPFDVDGISMCYGYGPEEDDGAGGSGQATSGRSSAPNPRAPVYEQPPSEATWANAPPRDESEPLPDYQGGPEDEWQEF